VRHLSTCDSSTADRVLRRASWLLKYGLVGEAAALLAAGDAMSREQPFAPSTHLPKAPLSRFGIAPRLAGLLQCGWYGGSPWLALQWEAALMRAEAEVAARVETVVEVPSDDYEHFY
jgi:hypothetical protein